MITREALEHNTFDNRVHVAVQKVWTSLYRRGTDREAARFLVRTVIGHRDRATGAVLAYWWLCIRSWHR